MSLIVHIPLDRAMLCVECGAIFKAGPEWCPACTDSALISLRRLLDHARPELEEARWTEAHECQLEKIR